jgi:hypothetical protein
MSNIRSVPRAVLEAHEIALTLSQSQEGPTTVLCLWDPGDLSRCDVVSRALNAYFPKEQFAYARVLDREGFDARAWMTQAWDGLYGRQ